MKEEITMIMVLVGAIIMFWFALIILIIGRNLYGADASLLWASGILTMFGINGIWNFISYLMEKSK